MKSVKYNKADKDWAAYLDGEFVAYFKTEREAHEALDRMLYQQLKRA